MNSEDLVNNDAKYIRKEIQVNNEDIYFLYIYLNIFSEKIEEQEYLLNKIEGVLQSTRNANKKSKFQTRTIIFIMFTNYGK